MFKYMKRPYKECSPGKTVERIKDILNGLDLLPEEKFHANPYPQIHSLRVLLDEDKGDFGTNGKGRNEAYALASAYAEFLERMQNGLYALYSKTIISELKKEYGFYYTPDEKYLKEQDILDLPEAIIKDIIKHLGKAKKNFIASYFDRLRISDIPGIVGVPFYDTKNDRKIYLPLNLLLLTVGSNGMAAGNSPAEAIFQAICELLERWGAAEVFYNRLTPPTIPGEFLKQFEEENKIINNIEKSGKYKVTVKDFSANKKIPSIGVMIENRETRKYKLDVGADSCFQVALSRCLTEIYQGIANEKMFDEILLDIPKEEEEYFKKDDDFSIYKRYIIFGDFTKDGSGVYPKSLFGSQPHYSFDPGVFTTGNSYEEEVHSLISNLHKNGHNVYIRDVSFLGFPSVFVYIPEISALGKKNVPANIKAKTFNIIELDKAEPLFLNFENCPDDDLRFIAKTFENLNVNASITDLFNVKLKRTSPWGKVEISFFLTLVWYKLGELEKARDSFDNFLKERKEKKDENKYYEAAAKYFELKAGGCDEKKIFEKIVEEVDSEDIVKLVIDDLADPDRVFKFIRLPKCPRCSDCQLEEDCITKNQTALSRILYPAMNRNRIDQGRLARLIGKQAYLTKN